MMTNQEKIHEYEELLIHLMDYNPGTLSRVITGVMYEGKTFDKSMEDEGQL